MDRRAATLYLVLAALIAVVVAAGVGAGIAGGAQAAMPECLGRPATIVGQGTIHGTAHADVIVGGAGADRIAGGGGDDRICAGSGDDVIEGGPGSDQIEAGGGADEVVGNNGSDTILGGSGADKIFGKRGNDQLEGGPGTDYIDAGLGDDSADGGPGDGDELIGGIGTDHLVGGEGDGDVVEGDLGVDSLDGGSGTDDVASYALAGRAGVSLGGSGVDVDLAAGTAEGDGEDTLTGIENVVGTSFADKIVGDAAPNDLYGGGGIDELTGVGAGDTAFGGAGLDRCRAVEVVDSCELSGVRGGEAPAEVALDEHDAGSHPPPTFEVDLPGGPGSGALTGIVEHGTSLVEKRGMQIHVSFIEGAWVVTEQGLPMAVGEGCSQPGPETATCPVATTPTGLLLDGGEGDDLLAVEPSVPATVSSTLIGGNGIDTLIGGSGDDSLDGTLSFVASGDALYGGPGEDALTSGSLLDGQSGSDLLIALPCGETIVGGPGADSVSFARTIGRGVEATLGGSAGYMPYHGYGGGCPTEHPGQLPASQISASVERIEGSPEDDILRGDGAPNVILGRGGNDEVHGAGGDDFLVGGEGIDALFGEGGADRLYARDGGIDKAIDCGGGTRGDIAFRDPDDPRPRHCTERVAPRP